MPIIDQGASNNYVNNKGWVGGQSIVDVHNVDGLFLFTKIVCILEVGGQSKKVKILFTQLMNAPLLE